MIINFSSSKFQIRLNIEGNLIEQVSDCTFLGLELNELLKWNMNTESLISRANQRMCSLRNLSSFNVPHKELVMIYCHYVRPLLEQSSVVWSSCIFSEGGEDSFAYDLEISYIPYFDLLVRSGHPPLRHRFTKLSNSSAEKCIQNIKVKDIFPVG